MAKWPKFQPSSFIAWSWRAQKGVLTCRISTKSFWLQGLMLISTFKISYERAPSYWLTMVYIFFLFCRKIMQGLFSVLETELQSFIHFADRLDNLYVYHHYYYSQLFSNPQFNIWNISYITSHCYIARVFPATARPFIG